MKIWLDDQRPAPDKSWTAYYSSKTLPEILAYIDSIEEISFDHDLGDTSPMDGYQCAKAIILIFKCCGLPLPKLSCHSQNPVGRERIERLIEEAK